MNVFLRVVTLWVGNQIRPECHDCGRRIWFWSIGFDKKCRCGTCHDQYLTNDMKEWIRDNLGKKTQTSPAQIESTPLLTDEQIFDSLWFFVDEVFHANGMEKRCLRDGSPDDPLPDFLSRIDRVWEACHLCKTYSDQISAIKYAIAEIMIDLNILPKEFEK